MNQEDKKNLNNWTKDETDRVVAVFQWLLDQDKKQNSHLYTKKTTLGKGRSDSIKILKRALLGNELFGSISRRVTKRDIREIRNKERIL